MRRMYHIFCLALLTCSLISLAACGGENAETPVEAPPPAAAPPTNEIVEEGFESGDLGELGPEESELDLEEGFESGDTGELKENEGDADED